MPQGSRPARLGEQIRAEISDILTREVKDPRIGFVTLTDVRVSPDLHQARVFYTLMGDAAARQRTARGLAAAAPFIRREIGHRLRLRRTPELEFFFDESIEYQERLEQAFRELHKNEE